jgi:acyl-CoA reductase-like NAD-dependent aldehyde dehydrogenase
MFLFRARRFGFGPLGLVYAAYRVWRRLTPQQRAAIGARAGSLLRRARGASAARPTSVADVDPASAERVGAATAPTEENPTEPRP